MTSPVKILIIDDNPSNIKAERRVLELAGYQVAAGENTAQALELARAHHPDLILLDMNLGSESGLDICRAFKTDAQLRDIYVVILSATATESESQAIGLEQGADGYIARPISNRELTARVAALLRIKNTENALREKEVQARALLAQAEQSRRILVNLLEDGRRAEENLRESEERFASAFNASPDGIAITVVEDGRIIDVNPSFLQTFGHTREEIVGRSSIELNMWANPAERARVVETLRRDGRVHNMQVQARAKSGEIRDALVSLEMITLGNQRCMLSVFHDVTEVRRAEQETRLLQAIALGVGETKNLDETIENILRLVCEATGWTLGEAWMPGADGARLERHPAWHSRNEPGMEEFHEASAGFFFEPGMGICRGASGNRKNPPGSRMSLRTPISSA